MRYQIILSPDPSQSSVVVRTDDGRTYMAAPSNKNFDEIVLRLQADGENTSVLALFDLATAIREKIKDALADTVLDLQGDSLVFKGATLPTQYTDLAIRFAEQDETLIPFVKFLNRVYSNKNAYTRDVLVDWLNNTDFSLNEDGMIVGYKKVREDYTSVNNGPGIVNGTATEGHLDNTPGNILEIDRSLVEFDPNVACASGLHVGSYNYARGFSGTKLLMVLVDPADVISVPKDSSSQKMRVCKYTVLADVTAGLNHEPEVSVIKTRGFLK